MFVVFFESSDDVMRREDSGLPSLTTEYFQTAESAERFVRIMRSSAGIGTVYPAMRVPDDNPERSASAYLHEWEVCVVRSDYVATTFYMASEYDVAQLFRAVDRCGLHFRKGDGLYETTPNERIPFYITARLCLERRHALTDASTVIRAMAM